MITFVTWIETHKDFCIAMGALLSPFAAVFIGLMASKWQAATLLKSTRMQIRASSLRDYRQRNVEKLREEIAAQIFYYAQLRIKHQEVGIDDPKAQQLIQDSIARTIRIRALRSAVPSEQLEACFQFEDKLLEEIRSQPARQSWGLERNTIFATKIVQLGNLYLKILESEMQAAAEQPDILTQARWRPPWRW